MLTFFATAAELSVEVGEFVRETYLKVKSPLVLQYQVRLEGRQSIKLATGEKINDIDGYITVVAFTDGSDGTEEKSVGTMRYLPPIVEPGNPYPAT